MKEIRISCELTIDGGGELTWQRARVIEKAIKKAVALVFPEHRIRGLWVHTGPRGAQQPRPRKKKS